MRCALFWDIMKDFMTIEHVTKGLSQNIGKNLPPYTVISQKSADIKVCFYVWAG
jgi:hypothetical protein